jgi:hypothetical protein
MLSELDRKMEAMVAAITGPGGPIQIGKDEQGRTIVTNLPPTLPIFFDAFCALNAANEAVVADGERLTFADLATHANRLAPALVGGFGIAKGDRIAIAMRNCPSWIITYMAVLKAGGIATLINGWWTSDELAHALKLTEPTLVIADESRARRVAAAGYSGEIVSLQVDGPLDEALAPLLARGTEATLPAVGPDDHATILFTSGSTGKAKGALSTHRAVTTGVYNYTISLASLKAILESEGRPPPNPLRTLINVPLFHVTGEIPVMLNSFVINRCMVLMKKWDPGEALRLIEQEKITYFVGVPTMSLELMQHPDHDKYDLSTLSDIAAGGRSTPGRPCPPTQGDLHRRPAGDRLWPDRNQRRWLRQRLVQLRRQARLHRPPHRADRRACHNRRRRKQAPRRRTGRNRHPLGGQHRLLLEGPRSHRGGLHRRRLHEDRRHRLSRRGQLPLHRRPQEGHHHPRRREYRMRGGRGRNLRPRSGGRSQRVRRSR